LFASAGISLNGLATASVYAKTGTQNFLVVQINTAVNTSAAFITFNLTNGSVGTSTSVIGSLTLTGVALDVGNGWYRCSVSCTATTDIVVRIGASNAANTRNGDDGGTIAIWGAQLNVGALQPYYSTTVKNLLGYSQAFDNAAWTKTNSSITANATAAPDGSVTGDKLVENTASGQHFINVAGITTISGTPYTASVYMKAAERTFAAIEAVLTTGGVEGVFNLTAGTVTLSAYGGAAAPTGSITSVGNGWYRCVVTFTANGASTALRATKLYQNSTTQSYTGDGTSGIFIWGAQLSDSASLDPYVYNPVAAPSNVAYYGPRFDYAPTTLQPLGLLIEEQRTNLLLQSGFAGAVVGSPGAAPTSWTLASTSGAVDSATLDSLGQSAIGVSATAGRQYIQQSFTVAASTTYFCSVFVVSSSGLALNQLIGVVNNPAGSTLTYIINGIAPADPNTAIPVAGDRIAVLFTVSTTAGSALFRAGVGVAGNSTGAAVFKWPQIEAGAFPTSYIPTTTAATTRAADVATMIGDNFSNWYNQSEGTLFATASVMYGAGTNTDAVASVDDNTSNNRIQIRRNSVSQLPTGLVVTVGTTQFNSGAVGASTAGAGVVFSIGLAFTENSAVFGDRGLLSTTDTTVTLPTVTQMQIGNGAAISRLNGHIQNISYYPRRLGNAELQSLTV
jgi:hypothetical protein